MKKIKATKKIISILMTVLMLMSIVPVQSFAALSFGNPDITEVAFEEGVMVSMKEIEMLHSYNMGDNIHLIKYINYPYDDTPATGFYYENLLITFSDGKTVELDKLFDEVPEVNSYSGPYISVSYTDCKNAIENGDDTVPVNVSFTISFEKGKSKSFEGEVDCKIVESYVKSIRPAGELNPYYEKMDYYDCFLGQEMIIEYADGTTKTAEITRGEYTSCFGPLKLDGRPIYVDYDNGDGEFMEVSETVKFVYCDAQYEGALTVIPTPYRRIDIVDYTIEKNNVLTSITYTITKTNGETETYTKECNITNFEDTVTVDTLGAYRIDVANYVEIASFKENSVGTIRIYFGDANNEGSYRYYDNSEYDASENCSCICHKKGVSKLIYKILIKIWNLFGINEECKCGAWHWDE